MTTVYVGSKTCRTCGGLINPVHAMIDPDQCPPCRRERHAEHVKWRMSDA